MNGIDYSIWGSFEEISNKLVTFGENSLNKYNFPHISYNDEDELINKIVNGCSFLRLGDGEFRVINGYSILFQKCVPKLKSELTWIFENIVEISNKYKCIFGIFVIIPNNTRRKNSISYNCNKLKQHKILFDLFKRTNQLDENNKFKITNYNPLFFRYIYQNNFTVQRDKFFNYIFNKKYIIVTGAITNEQKNNNNSSFLKKSSAFIFCKPNNAFNNYYKIKDIILNYDNSHIILLALGPLAKVLGYFLIQKEYQVIDIGRGIEQLLKY